MGSYVLGQWNDFEVLWTDIGTSNSYSLYVNGGLLGSGYETVISDLIPDRVEIKYGTVSGTSVTSAYMDDLSVFDGIKK